MIVDDDHWILFGLWVLFGIVHSLLAAENIKAAFRTIFKAGFKYYRILYSLVAAISLAGILTYQYALSSPAFYVVRSWHYLLVIPILVIGLTIMGISIRKCFFYLSGIDVFTRRTIIDKLNTGGIHKFVRHPLYSGTITTIWSVFFLFPYMNNFIAAFAMTGYTLIGIKLEEKKLIKQFGSQYITYMKTVPMIIPLFKKMKMSN